MKDTVKSTLTGRVYACVTSSTNNGPGRHELRAMPNERGGVSISIGDDIYISIDNPDDWDRINSAVQQLPIMSQAYRDSLVGL